MDFARQIHRRLHIYALFFQNHRIHQRDGAKSTRGGGQASSSAEGLLHTGRGSGQVSGVLPVGRESGKVASVRPFGRGSVPAGGLLPVGNGSGPAAPLFPVSGGNSAAAASSTSMDAPPCAVDSSPTGGFNGSTASPPGGFPFPPSPSQAWWGLDGASAASSSFPRSDPTWDENTQMWKSYQTRCLLKLRKRTKMLGLRSGLCGHQRKMKD